MANIDNVQLPDGSSYNIVDNTSGFATQNYVDSAVSSVTKTTIGLGNVDNTSDLNKPISTATQAALDALDEDKAEKTDIATVESGTTASRAYSAGELVYVSGTLYRIKVPVASGATFTVGTNVEVTNVSNAIGELQANNGGTAVNIKSYTSSNPFVFPSDGYVELNPSNSASESGIVRILGANDQLIVISKADFPIISSVFVRKGMKVYTQSATADMVISFAPLI